MIVATRFGNRELRMAFDNTMSNPPARTMGYGSSVVVDGNAVGGLPAAQAAIRIASEAVAKLRMGVWRGRDTQRTAVSATWQARFFDGKPNPNESWFLVWEQTEASLTARNNAYWLKITDEIGRVAAVHAIHPDLVQVRWGDGQAEYKPMLPWSWKWSKEWLGPSQVLHFRVGHPYPGAVVAPSPVELHRDALGSAVSKQRYEQQFYERGMMNSVAVTLPESVSPETAKRFREALEQSHGGIQNAFGIRVFGGGATVDTIGVTLQDAQYIESQQFSVEEIARIFGVQASLLGGGASSQISKPISPEHEEDRWLRYGLSPRLLRIEQTIGADPSFFGTGARDYPQFDSSDSLRGDLLTEAQVALSKVQSGQWLVDEARAKDGMAPLPNGAGQIPQIVPVGGGPNPVSLPAPSAPTDDTAQD